MQDGCCSLQTNACRQIHGGKHVCSSHPSSSLPTPTDCWNARQNLVHRRNNAKQQPQQKGPRNAQPPLLRPQPCVGGSTPPPNETQLQTRPQESLRTSVEQQEDGTGSTAVAGRRVVNRLVSEASQTKRRGETNNGQLLFFFFLVLRESLAGSDSQAFNWIGKMFAEQVVMAAATLQRDNTPL